MLFDKQCLCIPSVITSGIGLNGKLFDDSEEFDSSEVSSSDDFSIIFVFIVFRLIVYELLIVCEVLCFLEPCRFIFALSLEIDKRENWLPSWH